MDDSVPPVIKEKPIMGRQMQTNIIPSDMFDTMKLVAAKKTLKNQSLIPELEKPSTRKAELYHEGYIDGKMYLVPDSNLDAMKDIINFKMKPVGLTSSKLTMASNNDINYYDHTENRLRNTLEKLDEIESKTEQGKEDETENEEEEAEEEDEEKEEEEVEKEEEFEKEEEQLEKEEEQLEKEEEQSEKEEEQLEKEEEETEGEEKEEEEKKVDEEEEEEKNNEDEEEKNNEHEGEKNNEDEGENEVEKVATVEENKEGENEVEKVANVKEKEAPPLKQVDPNYLRFLISGHFRKDQKPIYIIQDYRGGLDLFSEQKAVFYTKQKEGDIDFTMTGRFFNKRILEESEGKPKALNIKPHKIMIDEKSSTVHEKYFEQVYKFNSVDITLQGEFIKSSITKRTTPFLKIAVKHKNQANKRKASTAVLIYKPECDNPFVKLDEQNEKYNSFTNDDHQDFKSNSLMIQSSVARLSTDNEHRSLNHADEGKSYEDQENYELYEITTMLANNNIDIEK